MTILEGAVLLILMLMGLPEFCRRIHRPGLLYPLYIVAGVVAGAFMDDPVRRVWREVGQFGFILLLFSVGLEIELPQKRESLVALRRAGIWMAWQLPLLTGMAWLVGVPWMEGVVAGIALAATSVGMAFHLWEKHPFPDRASRKQFLEWIVAVEVLAILLLAIAGPVLEGRVWWQITLKIVGIVTAVVIAALLAGRGAPRLAALLSRGLNIQVHLLVLLLFAIAALGDRLGLSAAKTAFVVGLFISRSTHEEVGLNTRLEPIRDRMFVPVFFFGIGMLVEPRMFLTTVFGFALFTALLLFGTRRMVYKYRFAPLFRTGPGAHLIAAPMLTMAAVSVEVLVGAGASADAVTWTLAAGLGLTLIAAFFRVDGGLRLSRVESVVAAPQAWDRVGAEPPDAAVRSQVEK